MNSPNDLTARIDQLHRPGLVDMHFDLLMDLYEKRNRPNVVVDDYLPQFQAGGMGVIAVNIFLLDLYLPELGLRLALDQVARLHAELDQTDEFAICRTYQEIEQARQAGKIALLIAMEGVEPLGNDINLLRVFYELGLRELSLTHSRRNWAGSGGIYHASGSSKDGLTGFGREIVGQCDRLGIIIDLAHINPAGFNDVLQLTGRPVIVSHSNPRRFFDIERNISDEQIKMVGERGGVIGLSVAMLGPSKDDMTLDNYVDQLEYVADLIGIDKVGLGFDFFESIFEALPQSVKDELNAALPEFKKVEDLYHHGHARNLTQKLIERGYSDEEIAGVLYGNFMRVFKELL